MAPIANSVNLVREGKLAGLAVSSRERDPLLPEVPTVAESGVTGYESILWFGLLTSSAVPRPIVAKLNREIVRILGERETRERWAPIGMAPRPMAPEAFDALIRTNAATFARAADVLLRDARGYKYNTFKIDLARRCIVRGLSQAARGTPQSQSRKKIV